MLAEHRYFSPSICGFARRRHRLTCLTNAESKWPKVASDWQVHKASNHFLSGGGPSRPPIDWWGPLLFRQHGEAIDAFVDSVDRVQKNYERDHKQIRGFHKPGYS
jgi:hypothetical protein